MSIDFRLLHDHKIYNWKSKETGVVWPGDIDCNILRHKTQSLMPLISRRSSDGERSKKVQKR